MKKAFSIAFTGLILTTSTAAFAREIHDGSCEIAVPKITSALGLIEWTMKSDSLQALLDHGYSPYLIDHLDQTVSGLYLSWGWDYRDESWLGETCDYRVSVRRQSGQRIIFLATGNSTSSIRSAIGSLPDCVPADTRNPARSERDSKTLSEHTGREDTASFDDSRQAR